MIDFLYTLKESLKNNELNNAFYIGERHYTYKELADNIISIQKELKIVAPNDKLIGLVTNDDIETYAAILAIWFEGKAYVPLNINFPVERNQEIINLTEVTCVFDSLQKSVYKGIKIISAKPLKGEKEELTVKEINDCELCYILFTSGSTGVPKGVQLSFKNINAFTKAATTNYGFRLNSKDRCLQMFELTFDMSVTSFLLPLLVGACVYTIPAGKMKYFYIFKLLSEQQLTVLTLVPSIINFLKPYFKEINAPQVRYCSFAGGSSYEDLIGQWSNCIPNSLIINYYGPTETTIYCGGYSYQRGRENASHNGILSIGTPFDNTIYLIIDKNNKPVSENITGELAIAGDQVCPGYWRNEIKNKEVFFSHTINNKAEVFYKTGDLCFKEASGNYMYVGRADFQIKIRGYRVELAEVEFHAKLILPKLTEVVAFTKTNDLGNEELCLAIVYLERLTDQRIKELLDYMKQKLPPYMVPMYTKQLDEFPHNLNGKIDRNQLKKLFS